VIFVYYFAVTKRGTISAFISSSLLFFFSFNENVHINNSGPLGYPASRDFLFPCMDLEDVGRGRERVREVGKVLQKVKILP
jgi:hypothetical protein